MIILLCITVRFCESFPAYLGTANRAMAFRKLGRFKEAIKDCNRAIQLEPENGFFYYNRALAQFDLGLYEEVRACTKAVCLSGC